VGRVNVYLIEDDLLMLIDAGPHSGTSFDELQRGSWRTAATLASAKPRAWRRRPGGH